MAEENPLIGRHIVGMRPLTREEMDEECWDGSAPACLVLDNGTLIFPSHDPEGNGPGCLFARDKGGITYGFYPHSEED